MDGDKEEVTEGDCTYGVDSGVVAMSLPHGRLFTEEANRVRNYPSDSAVDFVVKLEPAWSMEEDSPDQPSAVYSTAQPVSDSASGSLVSLNPSFICHHCSAAFVLVSSLELHLASVHGEKLHVVLPGSPNPDQCDAGHCNSIDEEEDSSDDRERTGKKVDDRDTGDEDGKNRGRGHVCDVCGKSFQSLNRLKGHALTHSGMKPFECDVCCKSYTRASDLKRHKLTQHSDNRNESFVCDTCSKSFTQASSLRAHKRIHSGERPYKCPHCERAFNVPGNLQRHVRAVHDRDKPFVCDVCGAAFAQSGHVTAHKRTHTGEKPFACSECRKRFAQANDLGKHRLTHTGQKPFVCLDCGKGFSTSGNLAQHGATHTGEKPHACPDCGRGFSRSTDLRKHRRIHARGKASLSRHGGPHSPLRTHETPLKLACCDNLSLPPI